MAGEAKRFSTYVNDGVVGKSSGGMVMAKTGARCVQSIIPNQREWLSVLVCVNVTGKAIPSFYIFWSRRFR